MVFQLGELELHFAFGEAVIQSELAVDNAWNPSRRTSPRACSCSGGGVGWDGGVWGGRAGRGGGSVTRHNA